MECRSSPYLLSLQRWKSLLFSIFAVENLFFPIFVVEAWRLLEISLRIDDHNWCGFRWLLYLIYGSFKRFFDFHWLASLWTIYILFRICCSSLRLSRLLVLRIILTLSAWILFLSLSASYGLTFVELAWDVSMGSIGFWRYVSGEAISNFAMVIYNHAFFGFSYQIFFLAGSYFCLILISEGQLLPSGSRITAYCECGAYSWCCVTGESKKWSMDVTDF